MLDQHSINSDEKCFINVCINWQNSDRHGWPPRLHQTQQQFEKSEKKNLDDEVIWSNVQTKFHQGLSTYSNDRKWNRVGLHTYCWEWQRSSELFELHRFQMFSITALNYMEQNQQLDSLVSFGWGTNVTVFSPL